MRRAASAAAVLLLWLAAAPVRADDTDTLVAQGKDAVSLRNFKEAERLFRRALDRSPDSAEALYGAGWSAMQQGGTARALKDFDGVLRATYARPDLKAFHTLALLRTGELLTAQRRVGEALRAYAAAVKEAPDNPEAQYGYGVALRANGQNEAALKRFEEALKLNPRHAGALVGKASVYYDLGNVPEAFSLLRQAADAAPADPLPYGVMGAFYHELKKPYEERLALGQYYFYAGDLKRCQNAWRGALAIKETAEAQQLMGAADLRAGDPVAAEGHFRRALKMGFTPEDVADAQLSHALALQGRTEEAKGLARQAIKRAGKVAGYHAQLAWICLLRDENDEAEKEARKALELDPNLAAGFRYLGDVYNKRGLPRDAADNYEKALAIDPTLADVYVNLGWAYEQTGDLVSARRNYELFLRTGPDRETAEKVRHQIGLLEKRSRRP